MPTRELTEDDLRSVTKVDAVVSGRELTLDLCAELRQLAPFGLGNPGRDLAPALVRARRPGDRSATASTCASASASAATTRAARSPSASASQLDRYRRPGRYDVVFRLEENHWNGTVAPQLVVRRVLDAPEGYEELRGWLAGQWRLGEADRSAEAAAIFAELELGAGTGVKRPLLESAAFRERLQDPALPRAA